MTSNGRSMEGLELVSFNRCLILMEVGERILCTIMVCIVVRIDGLCLKACNSIELLDGCCSEPGQCTEHSALDLCDIGVFYSINQCVLRLGCVILKLLGCVLL